MVYLVNLNQEQFIKKRSKWLPKIQVRLIASTLTGSHRQPARVCAMTMANAMRMQCDSCPQRYGLHTDSIQS